MRSLRGGAPAGDMGRSSGLLRRAVLAAGDSEQAEQRLGTQLALVLGCRHQSPLLGQQEPAGGFLSPQSGGGVEGT